MVSEKIRRIMKIKGIRVNQLAQYMGVKPQSVTNKFSRDSWSAQDLISVLDFMECQLIVEVEPDMFIKFSKDDLKQN